MDFIRCYSCMQELDRPGGRCPRCGNENNTLARSQPLHALQCGYLLHGRYVIGKTLGQGGFGMTYIGWDLALETRVCIKEYFPAGAAMRSSTMSTTVTWSGGNNAEELKGGRDSFIKEARKAVKLRKLNAVVQVWDVFYENETAYLVMDYVEGVTLKHHLMETRKPLSEEECVRLLLPVMKDLEEVHARGIIHRDISPDNLMLQPDGTLVLLDIGAAKDLSRGNGQSSMLVAKKGFSPLEQYATGGKIGPWTDVYAKCAVIVYCVTGTLIPTPMDRISGEELDLRGISSAFAEVLKKGLAINPEDRIQNVGELQKQLQAALQIKDEITQIETEHQDNDVLETERLEKDYQHAKALMAWNDISYLHMAHDCFSALGQYRDSEAMAERCGELIKSMTEQDNQTEEHSTHSEDTSNNNGGSGKKTVLTTIREHKWIVVAAVFVGLAFLLIARIVPLERSYRKADALMSGEYYAQAFVEFSALENYRDSSERTQEALDALNEEKYVRAQRLLREGKNQESAELFISLGDYKDSREMANESYYLLAVKLLQEKKYSEAYGYFVELARYKDSKDCANEAGYLYAIELFDTGDYEKAVTAFKLVKDYEDSETRLLDANYQYALALTAASDWLNASEVFKGLRDYQDSAERFKETYYQYGLESMSKSHYRDAVKVFLTLEGYKDSPGKLNEARYAYILENKNNTDFTTYVFLQALKEENFKDSKEIYNTLYAWEISPMFFSDSEYTKRTSKNISKSSTGYAHFVLRGGPPNGKVQLKYKIIWPDGSYYTNHFDDASQNGDSCWVSFWYNDPAIGATGTVKVQIYNNDTGVLLGEGTGTIVD